MNVARVCLGVCLFTTACSGSTNETDDAPSATAGAWNNGGSSAESGGSAPAAGTSGAENSDAGRGAGGAIAAGGTSEGGAAAASSGGESSGGTSSAGVGGASIGTAGSSSAGAGGAAATGFALDYSIWQLQLPSGSGTSPDIIPPSKLEGYEDAYFYPASDGGQMFMDPITGIHTNGSVHPRTEMRESKSDNSQVLWKPSATNTMTVVGKAVKCTSCTIAQVFNGTDAITLAELQYSSSNGGSMKLFYEEAKGQGDAPVDLGVSIPLDTRYTFVMSLTKNVLTVTVNGKVRYTKTPSADTLTSSFYFKVGDYDQKATGGAVSTTVNSEIEIYSVVVSHQ